MMEALPTHEHALGRIDFLLEKVRRSPVVERSGRVVEVTGLVIESQGPVASVGEVCHIRSARSAEVTLAEVVGFRNQNLLLMPLGVTRGIHAGSEVFSTGAALPVPVGEAMLGRILNALGQPLDQSEAFPWEQTVALHNAPPHPLRRARIGQVFETGIKGIDTFLPCGKGQRLGIFAGSGVGKSTLLGMIARQAEADVNVIALIGERGREVREFIENDLGEEGRRKSVVIVATSDQPPLVRVKGAFMAMRIAEHFRDSGRNVLLMMDSVTRFATAQREIGLAIGEPPATRGYTPSVFSLLPQLLERAGNSEHGTITGLFSVLVESDDMDEPVADAVRSILDGHIVLSRELALQNQYPPVDVLGSVSRLANELWSQEEKQVIARAREALAIYRKNQDLITIGAYPAGSNATIDQAIRLQERISAFLRQPVDEPSSREQSWAKLKEIFASLADSGPKRSGEKPNTRTV